MSTPSQHTQHGHADIMIAVPLQSTQRDVGEQRSTSLGHSTQQDGIEKQTSGPATVQTWAERTIDAFLNPSADDKKEEKEAMGPVDPYKAWEAADLEGGAMVLRRTSFRPLSSKNPTVHTG